MEPARICRLPVCPLPDAPEQLPQLQIPYRLIAARELAWSNARSATQNFTLTKRRYLGPTSMDHELSFLMCNLGHVRKNSCVYDPFAGTGSILIAAAAWGARVLGTDIDIRVIRDGKRDKSGKPCCVYSNFRDYGLDDPVGLLRADVANPPWRAGAEGIVDAMLCDPPYGVRAGGRKMAPHGPDDPPLPIQYALVTWNDTALHHLCPGLALYAAFGPSRLVYATVPPCFSINMLLLLLRQRATSRCFRLSQY